MSLVLYRTAKIIRGRFHTAVSFENKGSKLKSGHVFLGQFTYRQLRNTSRQSVDTDLPRCAVRICRLECWCCKSQVSRKLFSSQVTVGVAGFGRDGRAGLSRHRRGGQRSPGQRAATANKLTLGNLSLLLSKSACATHIKHKEIFGLCNLMNPL